MFRNNQTENSLICIRQFVFTVVENMLSGVGKAAYLSCSLNTHPAYQESIKPGGMYWKVLQAVHDVRPKIVPLKSLSAKFLDAELFQIMKELFKEECAPKEWNNDKLSYAPEDILG